MFMLRLPYRKESHASLSWTDLSVTVPGLVKTDLMRKDECECVYLANLIHDVMEMKYNGVKCM